MSAATGTSARDPLAVARLRSLPLLEWVRTRRREEAALLAAAAAAWAAWCGVMSVTDAAAGGDPGADGGAHRHPAAVLGAPLGDAAVPPEPASAGAGLLAALAMWALMAAAMMLPTVLPAVRYVADVSRPALRSPLAAVFALAYLGVWTAVGTLVVGATAWLGSADRPLLVAAIVAAALWELTPLKRRALARCCRTAPIRLRGLAAFRSSAAFGVRNGAVCVLACGPAMAVLALAGHPLVATVVVAGVLMGEKVRRHGDRLRPWGAAAGLVLAAGAIVA
ncbi:MULTISPECIES: copper chaperone [unclassified Agromyces]|uniref:copper chaperone n=1 Tax=unclassified Agromyces TaxID=2639701 RepID=UPI0030155AC5